MSRGNRAGGVALTSHVRTQLMKKLGGGAGSELAGAYENAKRESSKSLSAQNAPVGPRGDASSFLLLKNMFDPEEETEPNWAAEIGEDIASECSKYGKVLDLNVVETSKGDVYIAFRATTEAKEAALALHGRMFGGKKVEVAFLKRAEYLEQNPSARLKL